MLDNLSSRKSTAASKALRDADAWFLILPPYCPELNLIEMASSKLWALIGNAAARTYKALWQAVGDMRNLFSEGHC